MNTVEYIVGIAIGFALYTCVILIARSVLERLK